MSEGEKQPQAAWLSPVAGWYLAFVMFLAYVAGQIDRQVMAMLVQPMKRDLHLSDEQLGILMGLAFSLTYAVTIIFAAYLGDRTSRKKVLSIGIAIWSLLTMLCGLAQSFAVLLLARLGVGMGEASLAPSALPMIASAFPPEKRSYPVAFCISGSSVGLVITPIIIGFIIHITDGVTFGPYPVIGSLFGWQMAFLVAGGCGLIVLALMPFVKEPKNVTGGRGAIRIHTAFRHFVSHPRFYFAIFFTMPVFTIATYAIIAWMPAYMERSFDIDSRMIGLLLGLGFAPAAIVGPLAAGWLGTWATKSSDDRAHFKLLMWLIPCAAIGIAIPMQMPTPWTATIAFAVAVCFSNTIMIYGLLNVQQVVQPQYRGQATAILAAIMSLLGSGIGPVIVGTLTTRVVGEDALGTAILIALAISIPLSLLIQLVAIYDPKAHPRDTGGTVAPAAA